MASTVTLANYRTRIQQAADLENADFVDSAELNTRINASAHRLYQLYAQFPRASGIFSTDTIATVADTAIYSLPSDFMDYVQVRAHSTDATKKVRMIQGDITEVDIEGESSSPWRFNGGVSSAKYVRWGQNQIAFAPTPNSVYTVTLYYVPDMTEVTVDGNAFTWVHPGHEDWIVLDVCRHALRKEESDASDYKQELAEMTQRIARFFRSIGENTERDIVDEEGWFGFYDRYLI